MPKTQPDPQPTTQPDPQPAIQSESLHPSAIDLRIIKNEGEMKTAQASIDEWTNSVLKDLRQVLEQHHIKTFAFGFIQEGTKVPLAVAGGHKYDAARCAAALLRQMKEQIDQDLTV
jgi:hypothetical protein